MDHPVVVAVLDGRESRRNAHIRNASAWGFAVEMQTPVAPGAMVRIETEDGAVLGKASYCREVAGSYFIGVKLEQPLLSLSSIAAALDELDEEARKATGRAR